MNYKEVIFSFQPLQPWSEILVAYLSDLDFESFEDINEGVRAYIKEDDFNFSDIERVCSQLDCKIDINHKVIKQENWNAKWESDFQPITIGNKCGIRADFHEPLEVEHEIIITPKMSFGTGHHATTYGMMEAMLSLDFQEKKVLDMLIIDDFLSEEKVFPSHILLNFFISFLVSSDAEPVRIKVFNSSI